MTAEGRAVGFLVRLLLGGAVISGTLLYASQTLQKAPATDKEAAVERIGPTLSQPKPIAAAAPLEARPQPVPPPPAPVAPPAAAPAPIPDPPAVQAPAPVEPTPPAMVRAARPPPAPAPVDQPASTASTTEDPATDAPVDLKPRAAGRQRGAAGCTGYKSYNPATQTYRSYDGKIRECRP